PTTSFAADSSEPSRRSSCRRRTQPNRALSPQSMTATPEIVFAGTWCPPPAARDQQTCARPTLPIGSRGVRQRARRRAAAARPVCATLSSCGANLTLVGKFPGRPHRVDQCRRDATNDRLKNARSSSFNLVIVPVQQQRGHGESSLGQSALNNSLETAVSL